MQTKAVSISQFLSIAVVLTGYPKTTLEGTGMTEPYFDKFTEAVGSAVRNQFLSAAAAIIKKYGNSPAQLEKEIRAQLIDNSRYGALSNNIIQLWYTGTWFALPTQWQTLYGEVPGIAENQTVSAEAYQQGLIWDAIGAHPPGAKQPGFGSWALNPLQTTK